MDDLIKLQDHNFSIQLKSLVKAEDNSYLLKALAGIEGDDLNLPFLLVCKCYEGSLKLTDLRIEESIPCSDHNTLDEWYEVLHIDTYKLLDNIEKILELPEVISGVGDFINNRTSRDTNPDTLILLVELCRDGVCTKLKEVSEEQEREYS